MYKSTGKKNLLKDLKKHLIKWKMQTVILVAKTILRVSILSKLIYTYKAIPKEFFSPPGTWEVESKIYWESSSLRKNSRSYMQKKWQNWKIAILQLLFPASMDTKTIKWKVDKEIKLTIPNSLNHLCIYYQSETTSHHMLHDVTQEVHLLHFCLKNWSWF